MRNILKNRKLVIILSIFSLLYALLLWVNMSRIDQEILSDYSAPIGLFIFIEILVLFVVYLKRVSKPAFYSAIISFLLCNMILWDGSTGEPNVFLGSTMIVIPFSFISFFIPVYVVLYVIYKIVEKRNKE